jgi:hypothetical protein
MTKEVTMSFASPLRTLLVALASLALLAPAALARPAEAPASSLSGTTEEGIPGHGLRRAFDPLPWPVSPREAALAQERYYSTYGEAATTPVTDAGDGVAWLPFVLGLSAALVVGLGAGSGLQARRHATRPAI